MTGLSKPSKLKELSFSDMGQPFTQIPVNSSVILHNLEFSDMGRLFVSNERRIDNKACEMIAAGIL